MGQEQLNLPDDFDRKQEIINFKFAFSMQMLIGYEKRLLMETNRLKTYLEKYFEDKNIIEKIMTEIQNEAWNEMKLDKEFMKALNKVKV